MPLSFIIAGLTALGPAAQTSAAVGMSSVATTATVVGAMAEIPKKLLLAAAAIAAGLIITDQLKKRLEKAYNDGFKEGCASASREFEVKFQNLTKEFCEKICEVEEAIKQSKDREAAQEGIAKEACELLGMAVGIIKDFKAKGESPHEDTMKSYEFLVSCVNNLDKQVA